MIASQRAHCYVNSLYVCVLLKCTCSGVWHFEGMFLLGQELTCPFQVYMCTKGHTVSTKSLHLRSWHKQQSDVNIWVSTKQLWRLVVSLVKKKIQTIVLRFLRELPRNKHYLKCKPLVMTFINNAPTGRLPFCTVISPSNECSFKYPNQTNDYCTNSL